MDFYEPLSRLRDYFLLTREPAKVELLNAMLTALDDVPSNFGLSLEECKALQNFFMTCGYIDHENHGAVHDIIKRLQEHIDEEKDTVS